MLLHLTANLLQQKLFQIITATWQNIQDYTKLYKTLQSYTRGYTTLHNYTQIYTILQHFTRLYTFLQHSIKHLYNNFRQKKLTTNLQIIKQTNRTRIYIYMWSKFWLSGFWWSKFFFRGFCDQSAHQTVIRHFAHRFVINWLQKQQVPILLN